MLPLFWFFGMDFNLNIGLILFFTIFVNLYFYIKIKNPLAIIFLVAHVNYLILMVAFLLGVPFSYLETLEERNIYDTVVVLDLLFFLILGVFLPDYKFRSDDFESRIWVSSKALSWIGTAGIIFNIIVVFQYLGLPYGEFHNKHTIFSEIGWFLCSLSILFDKRLTLVSKKTFILSLLAIISLAFGARLQVSFFIVAFLVRFVFPVSKTYLYLLLFLITCGGILYGVLRDMVGLVLDLEGVFSSINQGASLRTSAVYLIAINEGFFSLGDRFFASIMTFFLLWIPSSFIDQSAAQINIKITDFSDIQGNGGFIGTYIYLFFGYIGSFLFPYTLANLVKYMINISPIFVAALVVTIYRWQLYNLIPVIKVMLLLAFLSFFLKFSNIILRKNFIK